MLKQRADKVLCSVLSRFHELDVKSGRGCYLYDHDGVAFLDFGSGIAVTSTGHCHPDVVRAVQEQVSTLIHPCIAVGNTEVVVDKFPLHIEHFAIRASTPGTLWNPYFKIGRASCRERV